MDRQIPSTTAKPQFPKTEGFARRRVVTPAHLANRRSIGKGCGHVKLGAAVRYRMSDVVAYEANLPAFEAVAA